LEQLTPFYDNTASDSFFSLNSPDTGLTYPESSAFMQKLLLTIELNKLADVFFQQLQHKLPLTALKIHFQTTSLALGDENNNKNIKTLDCTEDHQVFANISYGFKQGLKLSEWRLLQELHGYFKHPLRNALEYYKLKQLAMKDHLTSLGNRVSYQETLHRLLSQARRQSCVFGLLVIDLDKFKLVNDLFGHSEGDNVLVAVSDALRQCLRETDYAFRFGGDEFCCLLPDSDTQANQMVAARINAAMASHALLARHALSCSIGGASYTEGDDEQSLFSRADKALYIAKEAGRNCFKAA
jgi:diguanylate cyclase (GGDEF)-like protein